MAPFELIDILPQKVTEDMNSSLTKNFTEKEIGDVLFQIGPLKAPGVRAKHDRVLVCPSSTLY